MVKHPHRVIALTGFALTWFAQQAAADDWPQFRGARLDGVAQSTFPAEWDRTKNVRWKMPLEGEGWSCPIVWGNRVFLTAAVRIDKTAQQAGPEVKEQDERSADQQNGNRQRGGRGRGGYRGPNLTNAEYRWEVLCLDASSGEMLWQQTARTGRPTIGRHGQNTFATETPVTDGERVYAYFGMTGLYCYDLDGNPLWEKDLGAYKMRADWGTGSSPVVFDGKLYLQIDNDEQSFLTALDAATGDEIWRVNRDEPSQYSTPIVWQNSRRNEIIAGGQVCRSYDPQSGELLWQLNMAGGRSAASPLAVGDTLYVGTEGRNRGGDDDGGGFLFAVKVGGSGDITPSTDASSSEYVVWKIPRSGIDAASPAFCNGYLYLLGRRGGMVHCIDAQTGESVYHTRIPDAGAFWASPWTSGDNIYCLDDKGTTHVLAAGPEFKVIGQNVLDAQAWSTPAIANSAVFVRTTENLYCIAKEK